MASFISALTSLLTTNSFLSWDSAPSSTVRLLWLSESDLYFTELYLYLLSCRTEQIWRQMHPQWQNLSQSTSMVSLHSLSFPLSSTCKFLEGITMSSLPVYNSAWSGPLSYSLSKPPPLPLNPDSKHPSFSNTGSVQVSRSAVSDSSQLHEPQHARPPCPSPTPRVHPNPCPLSRWCHSTISSSVIPFSSCPQSFPASGSFQMSQLFESSGQSIGVSASTSVLPMNTQDWSPLGWTSWISLQSKGLSRVFSNTTVQKHQFFSRCWQFDRFLCIF